MANLKERVKKDIIECGICLMIMDEPKALPCLHCFCLKCLSKHSEGMKYKVNCPICVQDFVIPPDGIEGFIDTLKDRREMFEKLHAKDEPITCSSCGAAVSKAGAFCKACGGFICEECCGAHKKILVLQNHEHISLADLQSGEVDIKGVMRQDFCKEHKGQVLRFYCKRCEILICQECTVTEHPESSHSVDNLKTHTEEQELQIQRLMTGCNKIRDVVEISLRKAEKIQDNLEAGLQKAKTDHHQAADSVRVKVLADIHQQETELKSQIIKAATHSKKQIDAQKHQLQMQKEKLDTALEMAKEVTQTASAYDLDLLYSSLKSSLTQLRDTRPENVTENLGEISFTANRCSLLNMPSLGFLSVGRKRTQTQASDEVKQTDTGSQLSASRSHSKASPSSGRRRISVDRWKLVKQFGHGKETLHCCRSVSVASLGDFVVAVVQPLSDDGKVNIYSQTGDFNFCVDTKQDLKPKQKSKPWNVVVSPDGRLFITHCVSHVNTYYASGTYMYRFPTISPSNESSDAHNTKLFGLALDNQGNLLIGEVNQQYISRHSLDGSHIGSFKVTITPGYIAVTVHDQIIVSYGGCSLESTVQVLDALGNILHTLSPPSGVSLWRPYGLLCTKEDEVFIANYRSGDDGGIYCYSLSGQYLGCITNEVEYPAGLALTDNGSRLIVAEDKSVKIFRRK